MFDYYKLKFEQNYMNFVCKIFGHTKPVFKSKNPVCRRCYNEIKENRNGSVKRSS